VQELKQVVVVQDRITEEHKLPLEEIKASMTSFMPTLQFLDQLFVQACQVRAAVSQIRKDIACKFPSAKNVLDLLHQPIGEQLSSLGIKDIKPMAMRIMFS
jgi:hypothetical protein